MHCTPPPAQAFLLLTRV